MKIALVGYGKMGREIEKIALERGHTVCLKIDHTTPELNTADNLKQADVVIEFTRPDSAVGNYKKCFEAGVPVVSGTTGWLEQEEEVSALLKQHDGTFFYASNFSLGVNLFFALNEQLAKLMSLHSDTYKASMHEVHHTQKLDAPSGTAITLAEGVIENMPNLNAWVCDEPATNGELEITSERRDPVPGIHEITYTSSVDTIKIEHDAKSRAGFALGAVLAAEYACGKKGRLTMKQMLNL